MLALKHVYLRFTAVSSLAHRTSTRLSEWLAGVNCAGDVNMAVMMLMVVLVLAMILTAVVVLTRFSQS